MDNSLESVQHKAQNDHKRDNQFWNKMLSTFLLLLPCLFLAALGNSNFSTISDQLVYVRHGGVIGSKTAPNDTGSCTLSLNKTGEDKAQSETSDFQLYSRMGRCATSFFFVPVWGAFSDKHGRHMAIMISSAGAIVYFTTLLLVALINAVPLWIIIVGDCLHGILGSSSKTLIVACASVAADVFMEGDRTLMMISIDLVYLLAYTTGQIGGGYWIRASGFVPVIICMLSLHTSVIIYTFLLRFKFLKASARYHTDRNATQLGIISYFTKSYKSLIRSRPGFNRTYLLIIVLLVCFMHFSLYGVMALFNIYTIGPPLCWSSVLLGIYNGMNGAANALVPLLLGLLFLKLSIRATAWLLLIGLLSDLAHVTIFGFATTDTMMFVSLVVGSSALVVTSGSRAIIADLVDPEEQGEWVKREKNNLM